MGRGVGETREGEGANANACARRGETRAGEGANANACAKRSDQAKAKARAGRVWGDVAGQGRNARAKAPTPTLAQAFGLKRAVAGRGDQVSLFVVKLVARDHEFLVCECKPVR